MSNCNSCPSKNSCKSQATCNIKNNPNNNIKKINEGLCIDNVYINAKSSPYEIPLGNSILCFNIKIFL